ncbi:MAG: adenylate/guanylate cyclase domain-containing protein [Bacteroidia bacterium]
MNNQAFSRLLERGLYGGIVGIVYALLNLGGEWELITVTTTIGFSIGFFTGLLDRWLFNTDLRRQQFMIVLLVRTLAYLAVISISLVLVAGIYTGIITRSSFSELIHSPALISWITGGEFAYVVFYSLVVLLVLQFVTLVSRLLGPNVLFNYLLGRYHTPKEEERIFMFMDLRSSTTIAERLGHVKWHHFLNDFFFDIAKPVRSSQGEIYQYVGDEVVISWPKKVGLKNNNCIHCFFGIWDRMEKRRARYLKKYGYEPVFKAGYHIGVVIVGEIGDYKRDIVFHGDTVNTASRIQMECNHYNRRLLLSNTLLEQLDYKKEYVSEYITKIRLRGKEEELELYSLDPIGD